MKKDSNDRRIEDLLSGLAGAEQDELRRAWHIASAADEENLDAEELSSAYEKVRSRVEGGRTTRLVLLRTAGLAAALVAGIILGRFVFGPAEDHSAAHGTTAGGRYLILIRNDADLSATRNHAQVVEEFRQWALDLAEDGRLVDAAELSDSGTVLHSGDDGVGSRKLMMIDERATGYFLIRASSREEAEAVASDCPHLRHGGTIEIREVMVS